MSASKFKQLQCECETWKRTLRFMIEENIHLKSRLTEVIRENSDQGFLLHAERFHNDFLQQDDLIVLLRNDIHEFNQSMLENFNAETDILPIERKRHLIRNNVMLAESRFNLLKIDFHDCMLRCV